MYDLKTLLLTSYNSLTSISITENELDGEKDFMLNLSVSYGVTIRE